MSFGGDGVPGIERTPEILQLEGWEHPFIARRFEAGGRFKVTDGPISSKIPLTTCVLCGGIIFPDDQRNMEHPLPRWVHRIAGEVGELKSSAITLEAGPNPTWRQLELAAHERCNTAFGEHIEIPARKAIGTMVDGGMVYAKQIDVVLDWLDKVRSSSAHMATAFTGHGLVLDYRHIHFPNWRIGLSDRAAIFFRVEKYKEPLDLWDCMDRGFLFTPGALAIRIKDLVILSISGASLLSPAFGLPEVKIVNGQVEWVDGSGKWASGFGSRTSRLGSALIVAQPMRRQEIKEGFLLKSAAISESGDGHVHNLKKSRWSRTKRLDFSQLPKLSAKLGYALANLEIVEWLMLIKERDHARAGHPPNFGAMESMSDLRYAKMFFIDNVARERGNLRPVENDRL
ncbi:hypothetical protein ACFYE8_35025 [Rhizobium leguminosarum]|uniref:hypothetical protein n=1 Tax=Rhizobium leguminosarum TaxID=384 RepID=UPI0036DD90CD